MIHFLCKLRELDSTGAREFSIGEGEWPLRGFVVRHNNEVRAYLNSCPHAGVALNFKPDVFFAPHAPLLQCTSHGALFEPLSGECVAGPCTGQHLRELAVTVLNDVVYLIAEPDVLASYWS